VGAAALCCLGLVVVFHVGPEPVRTELTITPGEYSQNALANGYQMASYPYGYTPSSNPYGSVHDTPVYPHSPDTQAALMKRYQDYTSAIASAQASEAKMREVVDHYRTLYDSSYKRGFQHGQNYQDSVTPPSSYYVLPQAAEGLGKSADAWKAREKLLTRLHYEIVKEQSKLATQHAQEKNLLQKHQLMRGTVDTLLRSSAATAKEIQFLRDRYAEQIAGLQAQLTEAQEARQDQHVEWLKKSQFDWERASGLKAKVAAAIATSDYYKDKAHQAKSDQEIYRDRALRTASDAKVAKLTYTGSLKAAIQAHEKELEAIAGKNVAALKEAAIDEAMRQKDMSAEELAKAKAKLMEAATEAKVQTGIADAAKDAAMKAQAQAKDARSKYQTSEDDLVRWQNKILAAKTGADTAAVKAKLYEEKTDEAQGELDDDMAQKEYAVAAAKDAVAAVEAAEAQTALAKTQEKITVTTATQQKSAIELAVERVRREAKKQADRVHTKVIKNDDLTDRQEKMLESTLESKASVGDANNELALAEERASLVEEKAAQAQEEADEKKAKAEELLKTVDGLAGLAREAAAAAATERAKALALRNAEVQKHNAAIMDSWQQTQQAALANNGQKQTIDIHVIPHTPVMGPPGEEGMASFDATDKGTVMLKHSGINV